MTEQTDILTALTSSKTRSRIVGLFFGPFPVSLHLREIERRTGMSAGTVHRELGRLVGHDLLLSERVGNRVQFTANRNHPLFETLRELVRKSVGMPAGGMESSHTELLQSPKPGSAVDRARRFGVDLSLTFEQLQLTPHGRVQRLQQRIAELERIRGAAMSIGSND